jgi:hypothetical protein
MSQLVLVFVLCLVLAFSIYAIVHGKKKKRFYSRKISSRR